MSKSSFRILYLPVHISIGKMLPPQKSIFIPNYMYDSNHFQVNMNQTLLHDRTNREWLTLYCTNDTILFCSFIILTLLCHCACSDTMIMPEYRGNYALYK